MQRNTYQNTRSHASEEPYSQGAQMPIQEVTPHYYPDEPPRRRSGRFKLVMFLIILAIIGGTALYLVINPPIFDVTVNGTSHQMTFLNTIQTCVDRNYADPNAGDFVAVDGTVISTGAGDAFEATMDGQEVTDAKSTHLHKDAVIEITDGNDVEEDSTQETQTIPYGTSGQDIDSSTTYYIGPIHVYSDGEDGEQVVKTGQVSGITVTEVTKEAVDEGYHCYTADVGSDKVIALTFDDGPSEYTTQILDVLDQYDAKATFFNVGENIEEYPEITKRAYQSGHQIGTHTYDHARSATNFNLASMSYDDQINEVEQGFSVIDSTVGTEVSRVMRAPGGYYYGDLIYNLHPYVTAEIGWNVDTQDWATPGVDSIVQQIESAQPGYVVLMHDGGGDRSQTVEALQTALPYMVQQGYSFITIDELLAYGMPS